MEAYFVNMLEKSIKGNLHTIDLREAFKEIQRSHSSNERCLKVKLGKFRDSW